MDIFRTLGSGSLSGTAMLTFSGKANTSIHGFGEDDKLMMGQHWVNKISCIDTSTPCRTGRPWSCLWPYIEAQFPPTCYIAARHDRNLLRVLSAICIWNLRDGVHIINLYRATFKILYHPREVVFRYRDPQPQVGENYSNLFDLKPTIFKSWCLNTHFVCNRCF